MAFLKLQSSNFQLSHLIKKNPATGMIARSIRKGVAFGWYPQGASDAYCIWFSDADNEISYAAEENQDFEYLDISRYNSSLFVMNAVAKFFGDAVKQQAPDDVAGFVQSFSIGMIRITTHTMKMIHFFQQHFKDYELVVEPLDSKDQYRLTVTSRTSLHEILNYMLLLSFMVAVSNEENIYIENNLLAKIIDCANRLDAPYFVRYLIKRNAILDQNTFSNFKAKLETAKIKLTPGDTWYSRLSFIKQYAEPKNIVDFGCGEGKYIAPLQKKLPPDGQYFAIDKDSDVVAKGRLRSQRKGRDNLIFIESDHWPDELPELPVTVLLTEVLEHMDKEVALAFVKEIQNKPQVEQILITLPNHEFNRFFLLDEAQMRHPDHLWEPNMREIYVLALDLLHPHFSTQLFHVGDVVENLPVSFGLVMTRSLAKGEAA